MSNSREAAKAVIARMDAELLDRVDAIEDALIDYAEDYNCTPRGIIETRRETCDAIAAWLEAKANEIPPSPSSAPSLATTLTALSDQIRALTDEQLIKKP